MVEGWLELGYDLLGAVEGWVGGGRKKVTECQLNLWDNINKKGGVGF